MHADVLKIVTLPPESARRLVRSAAEPHLSPVSLRPAQVRHVIENHGVLEG